MFRWKFLSAEGKKLVVIYEMSPEVKRSMINVNPFAVSCDQLTDMDWGNFHGHLLNFSTFDGVDFDSFQSLIGSNFLLLPRLTWDPNPCMEIVHFFQSPTLLFIHWRGKKWTWPRNPTKISALIDYNYTWISCGCTGVEVTKRSYFHFRRTIALF